MFVHLYIQLFTQLEVTTKPLPNKGQKKFFTEKRRGKSYGKIKKKPQERVKQFKNSWCTFGVQYLTLFYALLPFILVPHKNYRQRFLYESK